MKFISAVSLATVATPMISAFVLTNDQHRSSMLISRTMTSTGIPTTEKEEGDISTMSTTTTTAAPPASSVVTQMGKKMSESIPFLQCPPTLRESALAGNVGFDPLGFAKNKEQLWEMREAEIKHARLAMLAAIGWPTSELLDRSIAEFFEQPALLVDGDRAPTILNGGLTKVPPQWWGFCIGLCAAIDMYGVAKSRRGDPDYFPGNLGFDPLNLYPVTMEGQEKMKLAEIKHGRTAMLGILGYATEEYVTKMAVVEDTPILFRPITETVEEAIVGVEGAIVGVEGVIEEIAGASVGITAAAAAI